LRSLAAINEQDGRDPHGKSAWYARTADATAGDILAR
jgi:hypothetical protein